MPSSIITLDLKSKDYEKILNIVKKEDEKLYQKILKSRDDNYVPKTKDLFLPSQIGRALV